MPPNQNTSPINMIIGMEEKLITTLLTSIIKDKKKNNFKINCATLKDFNNVDIRQDENFKDMFATLKDMKGPVLYWFEIIQKKDINAKVIEQIQLYANQPNSKKTPALKKHVDLTSNILYVGKVKRSFYGRVIQHLGFFKQSQTQGLQLFYWAKKIDLQLILHCIEFPTEMEDLISIIELQLAQRLKPIIGKHK